MNLTTSYEFLNLLKLPCTVLMDSERFFEISKSPWSWDSSYALLLYIWTAVCKMFCIYMLPEYEVLQLHYSKQKISQFQIQNPFWVKIRHFKLGTSAVDGTSSFRFEIAVLRGGEIAADVVSDVVTLVIVKIVSPKIFF